MKLAKRLTAVFLAAVMMCLLNTFIKETDISLMAEAASVSDEMKYGDYLYYQQVDEDKDGTYDYVEITGCDKSAVKIIIPSEINGLPVTSIGGFKDCSSLISIEIPNSVTSIYNYAFLGCSSLTSINVSDNNENYSSIDGVLYNKTQTELKRYPEGKKDKIYYIPNSITSIGEGAFFGSSLANIEMPNSLIGIGQNAFSDCISLTSIKIPNSVMAMDMFAFYNCSSLTSIEISNSVSYIGYSVFYGCSSLKSVEIPNSVAKIGDYAFQNCSELASIEIPKFGLTLIGEGAFSGCSSLTGIEIPKSVIEIRDSAFYGCSSLISIEIPSKTTSIGSGVFNGCSSLTSINVLKNNENYYSSDGVLFNKKQAELIKYPASKIGENYFIASNVKSIGSYAFSNCRGLVNIEVPNSVKSIGRGAFNSCSSLASITIKNPDCEIYNDLYGGNTICNEFNTDTRISYYNGIIYGYDGSTAQTYAEKYNYKFESLGEKPEKIIGDANDDGKLNIRDAAFIAILCAKGQYDDIPEWADYNGDGKRNIRDAAAIAIYCAKISAGKI